MSRVDERLRYFNPHMDVEVHHNLVPHWKQEDVTYFVTFRLADSLPRSKLERWKLDRKVWISQHPRPWSKTIELEYHRRFSTILERWLDQNHGSCLLQQPECRRVVAESLQFFEGTRVVQHAFVIMPNHVHALFTPINGHALENVLHSWKSFSANGVNQCLGRTGELWQKTYFDRIIRDEGHFRNCIRYIRNNPLKARLQPEACCNFESTWVKELIHDHSCGT